MSSSKDSRVVKEGEQQLHALEAGDAGELVERSHRFGAGTLETDAGVTLGSSSKLVDGATHTFHPSLEMAGLVHVQIQDGEVLLFSPACSCADVLAFLSNDPRGGVGTLTDSSNIEVLPPDTLTFDKEPHVFRKLPDLRAVVELIYKDLSQQRQMLAGFLSGSLQTTTTSHNVGQSIWRDGVVVSESAQQPGAPSRKAVYKDSRLAGYSTGCSCHCPHARSLHRAKSVEAVVVELKAAKGERDVQKACGQLFKTLQEELEGDRTVRDTSAGDCLRNPPAKVDFIFTADGQAHWSSVVWALAAKTEFSSEELYEDALGQVADVAQELFAQQPHRSHCLAVVLDRKSMELISMPNPWTSPSARITRTGLHSLYSLSSRQQPHALSHGMEILLQLFSSSAREHFKYTPPETPAPFSFTDGDGAQQVLSSFQPLQAASSLSRGSASVYSAQLEDGQRVVVKFSQSIMNEVPVLQSLASLSPCNAPHA